MTFVIEASGIVKDYDTGVRVSALRGVDLRVSPAEFVAIMGPSGSGKSTLLNILGALEIPTAGQLLLDGIDVSRLDDNQRTLLRRQKIGFIFQQFNLLPIFSAVENVALPLRLANVSVAEADLRARAMLDVVGLPDRADRLPSQLSGGEQQRVAIARALVTQPSLILADEPTGNLDSANGNRVITLLRRLVDEQRQTVVLVTHDAAVASRADRTVEVRDGRILQDSDSGHESLAAGSPESRS